MRDRLSLTEPSGRLATFFWPMTREEQRSYLTSRFPEFMTERNGFLVVADEFAQRARLSHGEEALGYRMLSATALAMAVEN